LERGRELEIDLLIACAGPKAEDQQGKRVRSLVEAYVDWGDLFILANYHRVRPLLYKRLNEYAADIAPESLLADMADNYRAGAIRNLFLTRELIALARAFAQASIPLLPHKGPLLAQAAYGDLALRQFNDLDLLIHPRDLSRSMEVLAELGYAPPSELAWLSPGALLKWTGEMPCVSSDGTVVDLHWRLTPSHYTVQLDPEILWRDVTTVRIGGSELTSLTPEALLLLLAVHGAKHCWESIGWLADIAWHLHANPDFNWKRAWELAEDSHCQFPLLLSLTLAQNVFQTNVPEIPAHPVVADLHQRVMARWYAGLVEAPKSPELFSFARALASSRGDTLKHLCGLLFDPTELDWSSRRLPESLFWLYGPSRTARLFGKYLLRK
jgi:putative nucleotidyltransferase-like protein